MKINTFYVQFPTDNSLTNFTCFRQKSNKISDNILLQSGLNKRSNIKNKTYENGKKNFAKKIRDLDMCLITQKLRTFTLSIPAVHSSIPYSLCVVPQMVS